MAATTDSFPYSVLPFRAAYPSESCVQFSQANQTNSAVAGDITEVPTKEVDNISIHKLLAVLWRRKLSIALPTLLLAVAFTAYAYYLPERYEARALLAIDVQAN